ncbi:MAG: PASTA domain-containing protein [Candidatus Lindowbacteria bacterium]|nr:PASTA domain-containing protein [Candidatus Lindowbacteria bacterium]
MRSIFAALALFSLVLIVGIFSYVIGGIQPAEIEVPSVVGIQFREGAKLIELATLRVEKVSEYGADSEVGKIIRQIPAALSAVKAGRLVRVYVVAGAPNVKVPNLVGRNLVDARNTLRRVGLDQGLSGLRVGNKTTVNSDEKPGTVLGQSPDPGLLVKMGSFVDIVIAVERGGDVMPDVVQLTLAEAEEKLAAQGYIITEVENYYTGQFDPNTIMSQIPAPGTQLSPDTVIKVVVVVPPGGSTSYYQPTGFEAAPANTSFGFSTSAEETVIPEPVIEEPSLSAPVLNPPTWKLGDKSIAEQLLEDSPGQ